MARHLPLGRDVRRMGTASLDLCAVASGRVDAYFERTLSPWDHAAGALIAAEAGAAVVGMPGQRADDRFLLAGHPAVVANLAPLLASVAAYPVADEASSH